MRLAVLTEFFENDKNSAGKHMTDLVIELHSKFEKIDVYTLNHEPNINNIWPTNVEIHSLGLNISNKSQSYYKRFFLRLI